MTRLIPFIACSITCTRDNCSVFSVLNKFQALFLPTQESALPTSTTPVNFSPILRKVYCRNCTAKCPPLLRFQHFIFRFIVTKSHLLVTFRFRNYSNKASPQTNDRGMNITLLNAMAALQCLTLPNRVALVK